MKDNEGRLIYPDKSHEHFCEWSGCITQVYPREGSHYFPKFCPAHLPLARKNNTKLARKAKQEIGIEREKASLESVVSPTGQEIFVTDVDEKAFYNARKDAYLKDFELVTAADTSLLALLLSLELECRRIEVKLQKKSADKWLQESLMKATEQIRRVQQDLGINKAQRDGRDTNRTPGDMVSDLIKRFTEYRNKNKDQFVWICSKCGEKHILNRRNNGEYIEEKK